MDKEANPNEPKNEALLPYLSERFPNSSEEELLEFQRSWEDGEKHLARDQVFISKRHADLGHWWQDRMVEVPQVVEYLKKDPDFPYPGGGGKAVGSEESGLLMVKSFANEMARLIWSGDWETLQRVANAVRDQQEKGGRIETPKQLMLWTLNEMADTEARLITKGELREIVQGRFHIDDRAFTRYLKELGLEGLPRKRPGRRSKEK